MIILFDKILIMFSQVNANISLFSFSITTRYVPVKSASNSLSFDITLENPISKLNKNFWNNNSNPSGKLIYIFILLL